MQLECERLHARIVDLVRDHEHGLLRLAEDLGDLLVARRDPDLGVDDEEDEVGLADRLACLDGDRPRDRRLVGDVDAAGVDQEEAPAVRPLDDELLAVARDARGLVDDRLPRAAQPVDERRLADVREADDRDRAEKRRRSLRLVLPLELVVELLVEEILVCLVVGHGQRSLRPRAALSAADALTRNGV